MSAYDSAAHLCTSSYAFVITSSMFVLILGVTPSFCGCMTICAAMPQELSYPDGKVEQIYLDGRRTVVFGNGTRKHQFPDGHTTIHFTNKDIKRFYPSGKLHLPTCYAIMCHITCKTKQNAQSVRQFMLHEQTPLLDTRPHCLWSLVTCL